MNPCWEEVETNKHQDRVIAHVIGTTPLGHFVADNATHLLLDIDFIWTIYPDGEMMLLPQKVAISELDLTPDEKSDLSIEAEQLLDGKRETETFRFISLSPVNYPIEDVRIYKRGDNCLVLLKNDGVNLSIEFSNDAQKRLSAKVEVVK